MVLKSRDLARIGGEIGNTFWVLFPDAGLEAGEKTVFGGLEGEVLGLGGEVMALVGMDMEGNEGGLGLDGWVLVKSKAFLGLEGKVFGKIKAVLGLKGMA